MEDGQHQLDAAVQGDIKALPVAWRPLPVRVLCRKSRRHTCSGEETDCIFLAYVDGQPDEPVLVERYHSVSIELGRVEDIRKEVMKTAVPAGATIAGYPAIVADIGRTALAQSATANGGAALEAAASLPLADDDSPRTPPARTRP